MCIGIDYLRTKFDTILHRDQNKNTEHGISRTSPLERKKVGSLPALNFRFIYRAS